MKKKSAITSLRRLSENIIGRVTTNPIPIARVCNFFNLSTTTTTNNGNKSCNNNNNSIISIRAFSLHRRYYATDATTDFNSNSNDSSLNNNSNNSNSNNDSPSLLQHHRSRLRSNNNDSNSNSNNNNKVPRGYWKEPSNHRRFFDQLSRELQLDSLDDWYRIPTKEVSSRGGAGLLRDYYGNSLARALQSVYPDHPWDPSRFSRVPSGFWKHIENQRRFFDKIAREHLNIKHLDDWYEVSAEDVHALGGRGLLSEYYGDSLPPALRAIYPDHPWQISRFARVPKGFWKDRANQRQFFDDLAREFGITNPQDWYDRRVTVEDVYARRGGRGVLANYGHSLVRALQALYPEHHWEPERFSHVPLGFWRDINNQRKFLASLGEREFGIKRQQQQQQHDHDHDHDHHDHDHDHDYLDGWYGVTAEEVCAKGGTTLLANYYGGSLVRALEAIYPERAWDPARFTKVPRGHWRDINNQRRFFDSLSQELRLERMDDWYAVSPSEVHARGGAGLLAEPCYGGSLARALQAVYPEHPWKPWRFVHARTILNQNDNSARSNYCDRDGDGGGSNGGNGSNGRDGGDWSSPVLLEEYMSALAQELGVRHLDDWYRVSEEEIRRSSHGHSHALIKRNGGLFLVLKRLHPQHDWNEQRFFSASSGKKKSVQRLLRASIQKLFPGQEGYLLQHPAC